MLLIESAVCILSMSSVATIHVILYVDMALASVVSESAAPEVCLAGHP